jgi:hypothetical protein
MGVDGAPHGIGIAGLHVHRVGVVANVADHLQLDAGAEKLSHHGLSVDADDGQAME